MRCNTHLLLVCRFKSQEAAKPQANPFITGANRPMKNFDAEDYSDAGHVTIRSTRNLLSGRSLLRDQGIPYIKRMPAFGESRRFAGTLMDKFGSTRA
jgi:hypothetical protein